MAYRIHRAPLIAQVFVGDDELLGDGGNGKPVAGGLSCIELLLGRAREKRHQHQHQDTGANEQDYADRLKLFHRRPTALRGKL